MGPSKPAEDAGSAESDSIVSEPEKKPHMCVLKMNGTLVAYTHTLFSTCAFLCALVTGCVLHYDKITKNKHFGYPDEWFPSVSAAIGDYYPERSMFQVLIALTSSSRFALCIMVYFLTANISSILPKILFLIGISRTFACGGWAFITTGDDHLVHIVFMVLYIVLTIPYYALRIGLTHRRNSAVKNMRIGVAFLFTGTLVPLVYMFIQHSIHRIPGAYTLYSICEWLLVVLDITFDSFESGEFNVLEFIVNSTVDEVPQRPSTLRDALIEPKTSQEMTPTVFGFLVSVINWLIWWSVFTSVGAMIWYFPLWYMDISGYEVYTLTSLSAVVLIIPPVRRIFTKLPQLAFAGQLLAVYAYHKPNPSERMMYVGMGASFAGIAFATTFRTAARNGNPVVLIWQSAAFVAGLLCTVVLRIPGYTNNLIWPIMNNFNGGKNYWGVVVGLLGAVFSGFMIPKNQDRETSSTFSSIAASSCGLGAAVFFALTYMSEISNLPLFVWEGYPLKGPTPIPHGVLLVLITSFGLLQGVKMDRNVLGTREIVIFGVLMTLLGQLSNWAGFAVGLGAVFYLTTFFPSLLFSAAMHNNTAVVFTLASLITVILYFMETWTVAYAFVPGGWLLRERTWFVMTVETVFVGIGVLNARNGLSKNPSSDVKLRKVVGIFLIFLSASASIATFQRWNRPVPVPLHSETESFNAGIWTVHFGLDNMLWASEQRMADLIHDAELDIVGLLETDTQHTVGGHRDITQKLAETLGFYVDYGPSPRKHTWGCALLSKFPIMNSTHYLTPSPHGELAPAIHATLLVYGELVDVVVYHAGQEEDVLDRKLQTEYVAEILHSTGKRPTILLSYLVTRPLIGNYLKWVSAYTGMHDIDSKDHNRWCEYILYKNIKRVAYARVSRNTITDTELQIGKFQVGADPDYSNQRILEHEIHPLLRMPHLFNDIGVRGHRYHVFDRALYYL